MEVTVDGVPVNLKFSDDPVSSPYRVVSPEFEALIPLDNLYGSIGQGEFPCPLVHGKYDCHPYYGDGIYLMLAPLSAGHHEIHIVVYSPNTPGSNGGSFALDVRYALTVKGGHGHESEDGSALPPWQMNCRCEFICP